MRYNKDNYLSWQGLFPQTPISNIAMGDETYDCAIGESFVDCAILGVDTATLGIDRNTMEFVPVEYPTFQFTWFPGIAILRAFRLPEYDGETVHLKYRWKDLLGNYSNWATEEFRFLV